MSLYAFLLVLLLSVPAWAATYYVAATGGLDARSCATAQTIGTPRLTITAGLTCLSPGDTLIVRSGTYNETLENAIPGGSSSGTRVTLKSETPRGATIRGSTGSTVVRFANTSASHITIDGFVIDASVVRGQGLYINENGAPNWSTDIIINNCEVKGAADGVGVNMNHPQGAENGTFIQILNSDIHDHGLNCINIIHPNCGGNCAAYCHGIYMGSSDNVVDNTKVHHNSAHGIQSYVSGQNPSRNIIKNSQWYNNGTVNLGVYYGSGNEVYNNVVRNGGSGIVAVSSGVKVYSNTVYQNGEGIDCRFSASGDFGAFIKNNIAYANTSNITGCTGSATVANTSNNTTADPGFAGSAFGDFHISSPFSPAVTPPGAVLGAPWNTDAEGIPRPSTGIGYTKGAYQFQSGTPPSPVTIALYKADGNANDSGGHPSGPFNGTLQAGALANGAGIVSGQSFIFNGTGAYVSVPGNTTLRPPAIGMALWVNTATPPIDEGCNAIRMGNAWSMGWEQDGRPFCWVNFGPTATRAVGGILTGTPQLLACGYDPSGSGPGIRLWQGATQVAFTPVSDPIVYSGSENLTIGGNPSGGFNCAGRIDEVRLANFAWQQSDIDAMFAAVTPATGISMTHQRYSVAHASEGNWIGAEDTDQSLLVTNPWGQRWSLHLASGSPVNENFRPYCRINHLGAWGAWTELTNSFGSFGLRYLTDTAVNVGDSTTPLLTLDGFTPVPGKFFADVVVVGSGFPSSQKIDLATGQHAEQEIRLQAGSPVVAGDLVQCKPRHESGADLSGGYGAGDVNVRTMTMLAVIAPATVRLGGGVQSGGTFQ